MTRGEVLTEVRGEAFELGVALTIVGAAGLGGWIAVAGIDYTGIVIVAVLAAIAVLRGSSLEVDPSLVGEMPGNVESPRLRRARALAVAAVAGVLAVLVSLVNQRWMGEAVMGVFIYLGIREFGVARSVRRTENRTSTRLYWTRRLFPWSSGDTLVVVPAAEAQ